MADLNSIDGRCADQGCFKLGAELPDIVLTLPSLIVAGLRLGRQQDPRLHQTNSLLVSLHIVICIIMTQYKLFATTSLG